MKFGLVSSVQSYPLVGSLREVLLQYDVEKQNFMDTGTSEDDYVEVHAYPTTTEGDGWDAAGTGLDYDDGVILCQAVIQVDERKKTNPRDEGHDFDFWARWSDQDVRLDLQDLTDAGKADFMEKLPVLVSELLADATELERRLVGGLPEKLQALKGE